ncbi:MAG: ATP-binding protein [Clostridia bacterium]|nr:ATP-binding protein [Clostridia bacterium]
MSNGDKYDVYDKELYRKLFHHANDAIFVNEIGDIPLQSKCIEVNEVACKLLGYTRDELLRMTPEMVIDIGNETETNQIIENLLRDHRNTYEAVMFSKEGERIPCEISSHIIEVKEKRVVLSVARNVTHRKKIEEEQRKAREAAELASRAKSEFLSNMSHEIRTPLNGISGMIDLTLMDDLSERQRENLELAKSCAKTLVKIINDVLDFSKIEAGKMVLENTEFDFYKVLDKVIGLHSVQASQKGIVVEYSVDPMFPQMLIGDAGKLQQVMNNLIGNAVKFTETGKIVVKISKCFVDEGVMQFMFSVTDSGIGISDEEMKYLFQSFSQVDGSITRKYGGTGLGLVISKRLVEMMGGEIRVESHKGKGSTFSFTVPCGFNLNPENQKETNSVLTVPKFKDSLNIVLAEDEKVNQIMMKKLLEKAGGKVDVVQNGNELLSILNKKIYDIILMDIQMPEMGGIEAAKTIRSMDKSEISQIPIVALTAYAFEQDKEKIFDVGMNACIPKPINIPVFFETIEKLAYSKKQKTDDFPI